MGEVGSVPEGSPSLSSFNSFSSLKYMKKEERVLLLFIYSRNLSFWGMIL